MAFSLYEKEELESIAKNQETNDRMEEYFNNARDKWNTEINDLITSARCEYNRENAQNIVELQATALAYRQNMNEQVSFYLQKRSKEKIKLKRATQEKMVWYAMGQSKFNVTGKLTTSQITNVVDAHTAEIERGVELIEVHIEFLRTATKTLSDLGYQVKNTIELYNLLSKN